MSGVMPRARFLGPALLMVSLTALTLGNRGQGQPPKEDEPEEKILGANACIACHEKPTPRWEKRTDFIRLDESAIWEKRDLHGKAFEALLNKQADYLIIGLYPGKNEAGLRGIASKLEFLPKDLLSSNMYVAFSKKSKCYASLSAGFAANIKTDVEQGKVKQLLDSAQSRLAVGQKTR